METLFELLPYACVAYVAFKVGKHWGLYQFGQHLAEDPDNMINILGQIKIINQAVELEGMPEDAHPMRVECVGDELYAYDTNSGQFLGQAPDLAQLTQLVAQRFPGKKFFGRIDQDNPAKQLVN
jgi:hypothetical protein